MWLNFSMGATESYGLEWYLGHRKYSKNIGWMVGCMDEWMGVGVNNRWMKKGTYEGGHPQNRNYLLEGGPL